MRYIDFAAMLIICCVTGCNKSENPMVIGDNSDPVIQSIIFIPDTVVAGESCLVKCVAVDADGDELDYIWESVGSMAGSGSKMIFSPGACCGSPWIFLTIKDGKGGETDTPITVPFKYE